MIPKQVLVGLFLLPSLLFAGAVVDTTADGVPDTCAVGSCTLREAIEDGFTSITFSVPTPAVITLSQGPLVIGHDLTITGLGESNLSITGGNQLLRVSSGVTAAILDLRFTGASANPFSDRDGGAIYNEGSLTLERVTLDTNTTYDPGTNSFNGGNGGAIYSGVGAELTLRQCTLFANTTGRGGLNFQVPEYHGGHGGAIYNAGDLHLEDSTLRDNVTGDGQGINGTGGDGGGLYNASTGTAFILRSTIEGNQTGDGGEFSPLEGRDGRGGGVYNEGEVNLVNSTLSGNQTGDTGTGTATRGGGLYSASGTVRLRAVTVTENSAGHAQGDGVTLGGGTLSVAGTILGGNGTEDCRRTAGTLTTGGYNLVEDDGNCSFGGNDVLGIPPLLAVLADNGGPTETHLPEGGSPVLDAGNPTGCVGWDPDTGTEPLLTEDQRGEPRPTDSDSDSTARCEIGSTEIPAPPSADLALTLDDGITTAIPGTVVTYSLGVSNPSGPLDALGATVTDTFPSTLSCTWTCSGSLGGICPAIGSGDLSDSVDLPVGSSVAYTITCNLDPDATGTLSNTGTVTAPAGVPDLNLANNTATDDDALESHVDLSLTKTNGATESIPGTNTTYTLVVQNSGSPSTTVSATVTDTFAAELACDWTCTADPGASCTAGPVSGNMADSIVLPPNTSLSYSAQCAVALGAYGTLSNTATVADAGAVEDGPGDESMTDQDVLLVDFGDAPDTYGTTVAENGARHALSSTLLLGSTVDSDTDGTPTDDGLGDDADGDDEDGVVLPFNLLLGQSNSVDITLSEAGLLDAWIDFDGDGTFEEGDERIAQGEALTAGPTQYAFPVPAGASEGTTFARFRVSTAGIANPTGPAADGEVEDYRVFIGIFADGFETGDTTRWSAVSALHR